METNATAVVTTASAWRQKARAFEAKQLQARPTVPLTLPSGAVVEVARVPLDAYVATGRLPNNLVRQFLAANPDEVETEEVARDLTKNDPKAALETLQAVREIVMACVVRPRIVMDEPQSDEEIALREIPREDFYAIYQFAINGAAPLPVETTEGAVSVEALSTFPDEGSERGTVDAGDDGAQLREIA